jgi:TatD DNase family protein
MIDTHAHILSEYYDNIEELVKDLKEKNVMHVLNAASNYKESLEVIELSNRFTNFLLPVIGIHPESVNEKNNIHKIEELIKNNKIYAVGEIGLDYYWVKDNKEEQKKLFMNQIELARKYNLPIVVHTREAIGDTLDILKKYDVKGVIHAYSGSIEMAQEFIKIGFKLGIGGVLTFKNSKLYQVIEKIDLKDLLLETDSPYLTPEPNRGKQNNPSNIYYVAKRIAEIKNVSVEEVLKVTTNNARELFDI